MDTIFLFLMTIKIIIFKKKKKKKKANICLITLSHIQERAQEVTKIVSLVKPGGLVEILLNVFSPVSLNLTYHS